MTGEIIKVCTKKFFSFTKIINEKMFENRLSLNPFFMHITYECKKLHLNDKTLWGENCVNMKPKTCHVEMSSF